MNENNRYLSDEELKRLINNVEEEGLIKAPAQIKSEVLRKIEIEKPSAKPEKSMAELYRYSAKVVFAIAAALLLLLITPGITDSRDRIPTRDEVISQERARVWAISGEVQTNDENNTITREEAIDKRRKDRIIGGFENFIFEMGGKLK
ncbi:hypothetical protein [Butyrivibrio sp. INlla14]|uniref:hypothetical protein n=1 Tax=Butyrivibrio sp. INlla14 TaxID=1520808 RepID=UPI000876DE98|nr:hypothetical protein [Butyrivibrio sp. INlla14]SCY37756.1 hypothetical protein SAMN02910371_02078 [Butyrivibrio sp. INlla14]